MSKAPRMILSSKKRDTFHKGDWDALIKECARAEFGMKGLSVDEIRFLLIQKYPHIYCKIDGEFAEPPSRPIKDAKPTKRKRR